ncbi:XRE family transcriptional regulator [Limosilactobacillus reuteri]|uniref:XRE family transcriptional regulator n=1 Tax=Limosilactobacillus reuteri TaxID=1598 RepID=A0A143Q291_LIMRT|nr:helix-turn-helix transcriptional regulator [Limosilactobacillus reuteri]AMY14533.1 hypothetical protein ADV92_08375 [Limosilactobacillus reuteri]MDZ5438393.1 helix-turn-helix transcriptional regulator [Limosilactobacillus reuteri]PWT32518.1 XRE family transcriptional regulator [Limosilactobacillus reuteri]PWT34999.1 XRE family transcriptional regulator [Limosilactobacillus reuteri]PWT41394.1 XRE family transcriptional regulator [Limosilactobacillus reuteri]
MNRIRECRRNKKLTLKQLSKELAKKKFKISADALGKYERGEREPKLETWLKLANFFNVSVAYLMGLNNSPNNNFDNIFLKEAPYDIDEWNNLFDTNSTKISTSLSAEQESTVVNSLKTYKSILISLIPYIIKEKLDTNELEKLKKNNLKMLINIVNTLDTDFWPESHITTMDDLENSDLKIQKKLNNILKKINKLLKDELKSN